MTRDPLAELLGQVAAQRNTERLLELCWAAGYRHVCVMTHHPNVAVSQWWFAHGVWCVTVAPDCYDGHWPAIWTIVEEVGVYAGCGNHNQAQVHRDSLLPGYYRRPRRWCPATTQNPTPSA